jgi:hypothetical protein
MVVGELVFGAPCGVSGVWVGIPTRQTIICHSSSFFFRLGIWEQFPGDLPALAGFGERLNPNPGCRSTWTSEDAIKRKAVIDSELDFEPLIFECVVEILERIGAHVDDVGVWAHLVRKTEFSAAGFEPAKKIFPLQSRDKLSVVSF